MSKKSGKKFNLNPLIRVLCILGILVITGLLINEVLVQPYLEKKSEKLTKDLYHPSITPVPSTTPVIPITPSISPIPASNAERDSMGRLLSFQNLLSQNNDTKGWITIPATNIDYVVMQNKEEPLYYLTRDFTRQMQKAGCLFLDYHSSVENDTRNLVIHGHNMKSTNSMFHQLMKFKTLDFYQSCPVFTFDTIYQTGIWKIFSVFISNGSSKEEPLFDYTKSTFASSAEFLNFIYQLRIRSFYNIDTVDTNEEDQIVTLSTCSYEVTNYRMVIAARKIRDGESSAVDVTSVTENPTPLYPESYYKVYGGKAPDLPNTFEEAQKQGKTGWYKPVK